MMNKRKKIFLIVTAVIFISWLTPYAVLAISTLKIGCEMSMCNCEKNKCCCDMGENNNEIKQERCNCKLSQANIPEPQTFLFSKTFKNNYTCDLIQAACKINLFSKRINKVIINAENSLKKTPIYILEESFLI
jgi:hypothetical protein